MTGRQNSRARRAVLKLVCGSLATTALIAQPSRETAPARFDVVSVKPCRTDLPPDARSGGGNSSPKSLDVNCQTLRGLIQMAWVTFADGHRVDPSAVPIQGGPAWINSDRYDVKAKAEGTMNQVMMHGPMLRALLEERFKLKVHRETREVPVYELTIAKKGPKLRRFKEGSCNPFDILATFPPPDPPEHPCRSLGSMNGGLLTVDAQATDLDSFSTFFLRNLDRPVVNKTGLKGRFDFHLEYAPDETPSSEPSGPSIFTALRQQLGLTLRPARGPSSALVIDSVERPSGN